MTQGQKFSKITVFGGSGIFVCGDEWHSIITQGGLSKSALFPTAADVDSIHSGIILGSFFLVFISKKICHNYIITLK